MSFSEHRSPTPRLHRPLVCPIGGKRWPARGPTIAAWMLTSLRGFETERALRDDTPVAGSVADRDGHQSPQELPGGGVLTGQEVRLAAMLQLLAGVEVLRSLAALYLAHPEVPITRGYVPLLRSLQEHFGRVIWLLAPGCPLVDLGGFYHHYWYDEAYSERIDRLRLLQLEACRDDARAARARADKEGREAAERSKKLFQVGDKIRDQNLSYTYLAEVCEHAALQRHSILVDRTKVPYNRLSESAHGGIRGIFNDVELQDDGWLRFKVDHAKLDAVALLAGAWWSAAADVMCWYQRWDGVRALRLFRETRDQLFKVPPHRLTGSASL